MAHEPLDEFAIAAALQFDVFADAASTQLRLFDDARARLLPRTAIDNALRSAYRPHMAQYVDDRGAMATDAVVKRRQSSRPSAAHIRLVRRMGLALVGAAVTNVLVGPISESAGIVASIRDIIRSGALFENVRLPERVDLSRWAPPVGNQGRVSSCSSWATLYDLVGWYARRSGQFPNGGTEPMYGYTQEVGYLDGGRDDGSTLDVNMDIAQYQGVPPRSAYPQGDFDYQRLPTPAERAAAGKIKVSGWSRIWMLGAWNERMLKGELADGHPVAIGIDVFNAFESADAKHYIIGNPRHKTETSLGSHAVTAFGYSRAGLLIQNSWGTGWGRAGWAVLSWDFVRDHVNDAVVMTGLIHPYRPPVSPSINPAYPTAAPQPTRFSGVATQSWTVDSRYHPPRPTPADEQPTVTPTPQPTMDARPDPVPTHVRFPGRPISSEHAARLDPVRTPVDNDRTRRIRLRAALQNEHGNLDQSNKRADR